MPICQISACPRYNRQLQPDEMETINGKLVCSKCYGVPRFDEGEEPPEGVTPPPPPLIPSPLPLSGFPAIQVYQEGSQRGKTYALQGDIFTIGRASAGNFPDLDFTDQAFQHQDQVSRSHARIIQHNGAYYIEDLGSKKGTWLNNELLTAKVLRPLKNQDRISLAGIADLLFEWK